MPEPLPIRVSHDAVEFDWHRLSRGGDRQANSALWRIVITRLSYDPQTRDDLQRRCAEGKTKTEAIRCLKRYVARELYACLPTNACLTTPRSINLCAYGVGEDGAEGGRGRPQQTPADA